MIGHPLQLGITVLFIMALCGLAGHMMEYNGIAAAWMFFAALFLLVFGVLTPSYYARSQYHRRW